MSRSLGHGILFRGHDMSKAVSWKYKKPSASAIGRAFGFHAPNLQSGGQEFIKNVIPKSWQARLVRGNIWERSESGSYELMEYVIELRAFPYLSGFKSRDFGAPKFRVYKEIRNILWDWIFKTKGMTYPAPNGGGVGCGLGQWHVSYQHRGFEGTFLVWIIPQGKQRATLIAHLTEARVRVNK